MTTFPGDFRVVVKLGEGSFAEVFKVKSARTGEVFATKRLKKRYRTLDEVNRLPEILALRALRGHPNIIDLVDLIYERHDGRVSMVFEVMDSNLYEFLTSHRHCDEITALLLIYQLLKAISFMHSRGLFHRDIKPENCMVNKDTLVLKLVDFGLTRGLNSPTAPYTEYVSTRWYRAPECILTSGSYGPEVDEWAVGCMLYELLTSKPLFPGKHEIDMISKIHHLLGTPGRDLLQRFKQNPNHQIGFSFPQRLGQDLHKLLPQISIQTVDLLTALLIYNPQQRISAADALNMECFTQMREIDALWERTDRSVPFPVYFLSHTARQKPPPVPPPPIEQPFFVPPPPIQVDKPVLVPPVPEVVVPVPPPPKPTVPPRATFVLPSEVQIPMVVRAEPIPKPVMGAPKPAVELIESRIRAAHRIKAYKDALKASRTRKPVFHVGPAVEIAVVKQMVFPKPRPEIVHPRLPKIVL